MTSACTCQCAIFRHGSGMAVAYVAPHAGAETWRRLYNLMRKRGFTARPLSAHGSGTEFSGANPHMQSVSGLEWGGPRSRGFFVAPECGPGIGSIASAPTFARRSGDNGDGADAGIFMARSRENLPHETRNAPEMSGECLRRCHMKESASSSMQRVMGRPLA